MQGMVLAGRYELSAELGSGSMGRVYRAIDRGTGATVAVKLLHTAISEDPVAAARLEREARLAATLDSPHIIRVLDAGRHDTRPFMVLEYVPGPTLADLLAKRSRLSPGEAVDLMIEIALALAAADARGVVHRDLKPGNIKLHDGHVKVFDFGIARAAGDLTLTRTGNYIGTPAYSAPERTEVRGDIRSDIYSAGVILYLMLAGRPPFDAPTPWALLHAHKTRTPPPLPGGVPGALRAIVTRCLAKNPYDRFQTPTDLLAALHEVRLLLDGIPDAGDDAVVDGTSFASPPPPRFAPAGSNAPTEIAPGPDDGVPALTNLPPAPSPRRTAEIDRLLSALAASRLVTLTDPRGAARTRLAVATARAAMPMFPDGVWFVELAGITASGDVIDAVVRALGVPAGSEPAESLLAYMSRRRLLLVLDNCEQVAAEAADLSARFLARCPGVRLLVTTAAPLGLAGEARAGRG